MTEEIKEEASAPESATATKAEKPSPENKPEKNVEKAEKKEKKQPKKTSKKEKGKSSRENNKKGKDAKEDSSSEGEEKQPQGPQYPENDPIPEITSIAELQRMPIKELTIAAKMLNIQNLGDMNKAQIVYTIAKAKIEHYKSHLTAEGCLEILGDGYGFLRSPLFHYVNSNEDIYVSAQQIRKSNMKRGDIVKGIIRSPKPKEKFFGLQSATHVNGEEVDKLKDRIAFGNYTAIYPTDRIFLETSKEKLTTRFIDLFAPIGKGQRALITAPPKTGKTTLLQDIANAITKNNPDIILKVLCIGERPEEVTDMQRNVSEAEVIASTFDETAARHVKVANMVLESSKRLVEAGKDVVILLDSITRLARAYNDNQPHSGRVLSGGLDSTAMEKPKRFFGAARNLENGGSLTIIATALIETGSRMDEVIFEEFKGTGNSEVVLTRDLSNRRIFPAINLSQTSTRKDELLLHKDEQERINALRLSFGDLQPFDAMKMLIGPVRDSKNNLEFLMSVKG